jgi:hypothetical protein
VRRRVFEENGRKQVREECGNFREIMKRKGINMARVNQHPPVQQCGWMVH